MGDGPRYRPRQTNRDQEAAEPASQEATTNTCSDHPDILAEHPFGVNRLEHMFASSPGRW